MKQLSKGDNRLDISKVDKYGRRKCDNCGKRRKVNAYWKDTDKVLCGLCSRADGVALAYALRGYRQS